MKTIKEIVKDYWRKLFRRPRYVIAWDMGQDRDYWCKAYHYPDGQIRIVEAGVNYHNRQKDGSIGPEKGW